MAENTDAAPKDVVKKSVSGRIEIPPLDIRLCTIRVVGDSMLCTQPFSEKAKRQMLDTMQGIKPKKLPREPEADYERSKYLNEDGACCVRAIAFKAAAVDAATQFDKSLTKVFLRGVFHIPAELLPIEGTPVMREDVVRVNMGQADLRYRASFDPWAVVVPIRYNARNISLSTLVELFRMAGFSSGVGEYRPGRDGSWGMYHTEEIVDLGPEGQGHYTA